MNQKELSKSFMTISNWKKTFDLHDLYKKFSAFGINSFRAAVDCNPSIVRPVYTVRSKAQTIYNEMPLKLIRRILVAAKNQIKINQKQNHLILQIP